MWVRVMVERAAESVEVVVLSQKVPGKCYLVQEVDVGVIVERAVESVEVVLLPQMTFN